jgi:hypothetical protein
MPYVIQDPAGNIIAINANAQSLRTVWRDEDDPAVIKFINLQQVEDNPKTTLEQLDLDLIRVIEDLTDLLIKKQVFTFTELPPVVQQKLGKRQKIRCDMVSLKSLLNDENEAGLL